MAGVDVDFHFALVPEYVGNFEITSLSSRAVHAFVVLGLYADQTNQAWPSRTTIAKGMGVKSARTVDAALAELVAAGAVTITRRRDDAGDPTSSVYTLYRVPREAVSLDLDRSEVVQPTALPVQPAARVVQPAAPGVVQPAARGVVQPAAHEVDPIEEDPTEQEKPTTPPHFAHSPTDRGRGEDGVGRPESDRLTPRGVATPPRHPPSAAPDLEHRRSPPPSGGSDTGAPPPGRFDELRARLRAGQQAQAPRPEPPPAPSRRSPSRAPA